MKSGWLTILLVSGLSLSGANGKDLYSLIASGHTREAADSLSAYSSASRREGRLLFFQALLEKNANEAARLMKTALELSTPARFQEEIYFRLAQYYVLKKDYTSAEAYVREYLNRWESGRFEPIMRRYAAYLEELSGHYDAALQQIDRFLIRTPQETAGGRLDKARIFQKARKKKGARTLLRKLSREKNGEAVPEALYLLGLDAASRNRVDDAVFYYNLLLEGYPHAVGLDDLTDKLGKMSVTSSDTRAEQLTGTFYSVQVGVFSNKGNARKFANRFKAYEKKVEIRSKAISGKKYRVVYVGRFPSFEQARQFKDVLERNHHEVFRVVAR